MVLQTVDTYSLALQKVKLSQTVNEVFTLNPFIVGCVMSDIFILDN